jgi:hypothetical protein
VGAPYILRVFGADYAQHATGLLRLLALAAIPNLVTETAVYAARARQRTSVAAIILGSISIGMLSLAAILLPYLGIVAVGIACLAAESVVAVVLLCRPTWWLQNWEPLDVKSRVAKQVRSSLVPSGSGPQLLVGTACLMAIGTITLTIGLLHRATSIVLASLLCNALSLVPLALFCLGNRRIRSHGGGGKQSPNPLRGGRTPIEDYDDLRVDEILPLLQELGQEELTAVGAHEAAGLSRPSVLARIDFLIRTEFDCAAPPNENCAPPTSEEKVFPILSYDELRVVDILPLLPELDPKQLDAVETRERSGKKRSTILSKVGQLRARTARTAKVPIAKLQEGLVNGM